MMKRTNRLKSLMLAASGFFAFQVAGCNFLEQIQNLVPDVSSLIPGFGG